VAEDEARKEAIKRLKAKQAARNYLVTFIFVNVMMIVIWALSGGGYFWPGWVLFGTGIGLFWTMWNAYGGGHRQITEADIEREMGKGGGPAPDAR